MSVNGLGPPLPGRVEWVRNSSEVYTSWGGVGKPMSMSGSVWIALPASVFPCGRGRGVTVLVSARRMATRACHHMKKLANNYVHHFFCCLYI